MTAQDLALFFTVCVSLAVVAVGMVATCIGLTRGVLP